MDFLIHLPVVGLVFQFVDYLIDVLTLIGPIILSLRHADRPGALCAACSASAPVSSTSASRG